MRRKLLILLPLMALCLFLMPDRSPVAFSIPTAAPLEYVDDGTTLPDNETMTRLARDNPVLFLDACLRRYSREVRSYSGELHKQERLEGKLCPPEVIDFCFREDPYSVLMKWKDGIRLVRGSMYHECENDGKALVRPKLLNVVIEQDPEGRLARQSSRYTMKEFSIRQGTERTIRAWKAAQEKGTLHVEYRGIQTIAELGGRRCHVLKRLVNPPEEEGLATIEIAVDAETWLQTGSTLIDGNGDLIGKYFFPVVNINPPLPDDTFTKASLKK